MLPVSEDVLVMKLFPYLSRHSLLKLKTTCKYFQSLIPDCTIFTKTFWNLTDQEILAFSSCNTLNWNRQMHLLTTSKRGCENCGKKRIRKIFWEYQIRACQQCKIKLTISNYRIRQLLLPRNCIKDLPYIKGKLWNYYIGSYELEFYLKKDVIPVLKEHFNLDSSLTNFEEITTVVQKINEARSIEQQQKKEFEAKKLKDDLRADQNNLKRKRLDEWGKLPKSVKYEKRLQEMLEYCNGVIEEEKLFTLQQFKKFVNSKSQSMNVNKRAWLIKFQDEISDV
jgi:hypothetical protein